MKDTMMILDASRPSVKELAKTKLYLIRIGNSICLSLGTVVLIRRQLNWALFTSALKITNIASL